MFHIENKKFDPMSTHVKKRSNQSKSYSLLRNSITLSLLKDDRVRQAFADFIQESEDEDFENSLSRLLESSRICKVIPSFFTRIEDFSTKSFAINVPLKRLIDLFLCLIRRQKEKINRFVVFRNDIEHAILFGDYGKARDTLNLMESDLGESIWLSRTKMLVLSSMGNSEEFETYCRYCAEQCPSSFNEFILKCAQLIADSGDPALHLNNVVFRNVNELNQANNEPLASLLEVLFCPHPLVSTVNLLGCLSYLQAFPIVDQYSLITTILRYELVESGEDFTLSENLRFFSIELKKIISDDFMKNISNLDEVIQEGPIFFQERSMKIYSAYSRGDYFEAIDEFNNCRDLDGDALSLVNIAAKAMVYANMESTLDIQSPPIVSIASSLATIYRISPLWSQAEDQIISLCIKHNHFTHSAHIQLALLKAFPFRYSDRQHETAARIAISLTNRCTPQTFSLAGKKSIFSHCLELPTDAPDHRILKYNIFLEMSKNNIDFDSMEYNLSKFSESSALKKDILECRARYYSFTEQYDKLLRDAAYNLIIDSNRFICYPMNYLFDRIESEQLHDLNSIIISYHYNNSVSDERDYVLNEAFNEYLVASKVKKPSELLLKRESLSDDEKIFFRDICVPDVMDYLECFNNSNELLSERILILDALELVGVIDPKTRMREVEDIVRQVIVDAGTSEFNGSKIYVNDSILKKKHYDEVTSLLTLYKKIPGGSDGGFVKMDSDVSKGAYISGSRNSLVERLYNMLSNSFLFDDKYGLDKNLSAEIRHGFFSNLMRARLEEWHLLTELDDKGIYLKNHYWREKNSLVRDDFWEPIDDILKEFSRNFDDAVAQAEEWMKVNIQAGVKERMFSFELSGSEFSQLKSIIDATDEAEFITYHILELLWKKTDFALLAMRERLNGEFKAKIDMLFSNAIDEIIEKKGALPLFDLMQAFTRARNDIKEDINTASEWFNRSENTEISAGSLDRLIEIAVRSFEKVRGNAYIINIFNGPEIGDIGVNKQVAKPFILAIINLLDNCYAHSGLGQSTRVDITGQLNNGLATVTIKNSLSIEKQRELDSDCLNAIRNKIEGSDISKHIRGEGGTGLIKARNEITYLGKKSLLEIFREGGSFYASITYDYRATL